MSPRYDGGSAFPEADYAVPDNLREEAILALKAKRGMSLRDYFAAKVMQAMVQNIYDPSMSEDIANESYDMADAMLAKRDKHNT